jgi:hypothetical protein
VADSISRGFEGEARIELSHENPTDHRLGDRGEPVRAVTIDSLVADDQRRVTLIKVDVQGAEAVVLAGAERTIATHRPALFLEVDDRTLRRFGSSATDLLARITALGYAPRGLRRSGVGPPMTDEQLIAAADEGKGDALFLPS